MADFIDLMNKAIFNSDNATRSQAELKLLELRKLNPGEFFLTATNALANEMNTGPIRQGAGTILRRTLIMPGEKGEVWFSLGEVKQQIKMSLVNSLLTKDLEARRAAADSISVICSIELPRKEWPLLIGQLAGNCGNQEIEIKKASILTLGYICEQLKNSNNTECLADDEIESILTGILLGMQKDQQNNDIKKLSLNALNISLSFMEKFLEKKQVRDYVIEHLLETCRNPDDEIKVSVLQCMIEFCKIYYAYISDYVVPFYNLISPFILSPDENVSIPAMEIWNVIATEDKEKMQKHQNLQATHIIKVSQELVKLLLQNLLRPSDDDDGELSVKEAANKCLSAIMDVTGDLNLDLFTAFINNTIASDHPIQRQAAVIAFGAMLEGPSKARIVPMVQAALETVINLLGDMSSSVKFSASGTLSKISEFHPECILLHQNFLKILEILINALNLHAKISRNICWVFNFLAENVKMLTNSPLGASHPLILQLEVVIDNLFKNAMRSDIGNQDLSVIDVSFMAIIEFIQNNENVELNLKYLKQFSMQFKVNYNLSGERRKNIHTGLLIAIQFCVAKITDRIDDELANEVYNLVIEYFKLIKDVNPDGIYVISSLATGLKQKFNNYLPDYWNFLTHALGKEEEAQTLKAAIGSLADLSKACEEGFNQYLDVIIPSLLRCIETQSFDREIKLHVFLCLGDIAIGSKTAIVPYLPSIMQTFTVGFQAAIELAKLNDPSSNEYSEQLKDTLIESYTCLIHSLGTSEHCGFFLSHFGILFSFIEKACDHKLNPTVDFIRNCLILIADIANFYKSHVAHLVKTKLVEDLVAHVTRFRHIKENEEMLKYAIQVFQKC